MRWRQNLCKKVYATDNHELLYRYLCEVEAEIKGIIGQEPSDFFSQYPGITQLRKIDDLLGSRKYILDKMFSCSKDEIKRVEQVNELLSRLSKQMYHRTADLYRTILKSGMDDSFDDDYVVEGKLITGMLYYQKMDCATTLHLDDDAYYGSDFSYMLYVIQKDAETEFDSMRDCIHGCQIFHNKANNPEMTDKELGCDYTELDDGSSWSEGLRRTNLAHICFCYAFHSLYTYQHYSLVDIIHINRFFVESKLVCQRITDQEGRRYEDFINEE